MIIYISGKVTGYDEAACRARFIEAEKEIESRGHEAFNPYSVIEGLINCNWVSKDDRKEIMRTLVSLLVKECDAIYMLDGWNESVGAIQEYEVARIMGIKVLFQSNKDLEKL